MELICTKFGVHLEGHGMQLNKEDGEKRKGTKIATGTVTGSFTLYTLRKREEINRAENKWDGNKRACINPMHSCGSQLFYEYLCSVKLIQVFTITVILCLQMICFPSIEARKRKLLLTEVKLS